MWAITLWSKLTGNWLAKWVAIIAAGVSAYLINNAVQRSIGEKRGVVKIVTQSNEVAKKRDAKIRKIRRNIKPANAWKRLRAEYPGTN